MQDAEIQTVESVSPTSESDITKFDQSKSSGLVRLSHEDKRKILQLRQAGLGYTAIGKLVNRTASTVCDYLKPYESTVDAAKSLLAASAEPAVKAWIASLEPAAIQGNHKGAKDLLAAIGVIQDKPETAIAVQVNMPGAAMPEPLQGLEVATATVESVDSTS